MPILTVITDQGRQDIPFDPGKTILEILVSAKIAIRSGCGGLGRCGSCLIRVDDETYDASWENEGSIPKTLLMDPGIRLACRIKPQKDLRIRMLSSDSSINWRPLPQFVQAASINPLPHDGRIQGRSLGIAVDLGTTNLCLTLWDPSSGKRLAGLTGRNPQYRFGADVLTRMMAACESRERLMEMGCLVRDAVGEAVTMMTGGGYERGNVKRVVIVGNTVMLSLLTGKNHDALLKPRFWEEAVDIRPDDPGSWCSDWGIDFDASIHVIPPMGGFVGSDISAGILATHLTRERRRRGAALLIDFGTNSEIALWDGDTLWVASAAGGPAFEGSGISIGMPAEAGAIRRIRWNHDPETFTCDVVGGGRAKGICGSGLTDWVAELLRVGILRQNGKFRKNEGWEKTGFVLPVDEGCLSLTQRDIDAFQRAKGAIGAGVGCLLKTAGMDQGDLRRVCICGAFGNHLNILNARTIGLVPNIDVDCFELYGNTALSGCERLLISDDGENTLSWMKNHSRIINLAQIPEYEDLFVDGLFLRPMRTG